MPDSSERKTDKYSKQKKGVTIIAGAGVAKTKPQLEIMQGLTIFRIVLWWFYFSIIRADIEIMLAHATDQLKEFEMLLKISSAEKSIAAALIELAKEEAQGEGK